MKRSCIFGTLIIIMIAFSSTIAFGKCTDEQKARMITNNVSQEIIDKQCSENKIKPIVPQQSPEPLKEQDIGKKEEKSPVRQKGFHDYFGVGFGIITGKVTSSGITTTVNGSNFGIGMEKSFGENGYFGISYISGPVKYEIDYDNSDSYIDGTLTVTSFMIGAEKELESLLINGKISQSSGDGVFESYVSGQKTAETNVSVSGLSASVGIVIPSDITRVSVGINKGIGGDYSDNEMSLWASLRIQASPDFFVQGDYTKDDTLNSFSGTIGINF